MELGKQRLRAEVEPSDNAFDELWDLAWYHDLQSSNQIVDERTQALGPELAAFAQSLDQVLDQRSIELAWLLLFGADEEPFCYWVAPSILGLGGRILIDS